MVSLASKLAQPAFLQVAGLAWHISRANENFTTKVLHSLINLLFNSTPFDVCTAHKAVLILPIPSTYSP